MYVEMELGYSMWYWHTHYAKHSLNTLAVDPISEAPMDRNSKAYVQIPVGYDFMFARYAG